MSGSLTLLMHPDEWDNFKSKALTEKGLGADQVMWGEGPKAYPCMAAGFITSVERSPGAVFACCYFYVEQAVELVRASGAIPTEGAESRIVTAIGPEQAKFNETTLAHLASILNIMVKTGVTTEEHYMPIFSAELQDLEQRHAEDIDTRLKALRGALKKKE